MRSNDSILLEQAYEQIFKKQFLNEEHDRFEFKGADWNSDLKETIGEDLQSLPKQDFYDAIKSGNLKEMSWYIYSKSDGYNPKLIKIAEIENDKIWIEDEQRDYTHKYIGRSEDERDRSQYKIYDYNPKTEHLSKTDIYPNSILFGPFENDETIYKIERYMDKLISRSKSMASYFDSHPDAPLD